MSSSITTLVPSPTPTGPSYRNPNGECFKGSKLPGMPLGIDHPRVMISRFDDNTINIKAIEACCAPNRVDLIANCYPICLLPEKYINTTKSRGEASSNFMSCLTDHFTLAEKKEDIMIMIEPTNSGHVTKLGLLQAAIVALAFLTVVF